MYEIYQGISHPGFIPAYPGYGYMNRDLWQTITSSHLVLQTKQGRIKNFKLSGVTRQVETTGAQLLYNFFGVLLLPGANPETIDPVTMSDTSKYGTLCAHITTPGTYCLSVGNDYVFNINRKLLNGNPAETVSQRLTTPYVFDVTVPGIVAFSVERDTSETDYTDIPIGGGKLPSDFGFMLNAGDTALPWEPYTGATSSPSPEYPQDIQGVGVRTAQLANLPDIAPTTSNGLTWSCKDGVITVTGTAQKNSDSTTIGLYAELHLQPGTYTVSGYDPDVEVYVRITRADDKTIYYQKSPFVAEATDKLTIIYAQVPTGKTVNKTIYPMLNAGNTALPWEPYGYRTDVMTRTEQLFDGNLKNGFYNAGSGMQDTASTIYRTLEVEIKTAGKYTYSFEQDVVIVRDDGTVASASPVRNFTKEYTVGNHTLSIRKNPSSDWGEGMKIMLNYGATAKPYQPYAYYTAPIYTREPLTQWDHIEYRNGEYGVVKKSAVVVEDGSRNVDDTHYPILFFSTLAKPMNVDAKVYCNYCSSERIGRLSILGKNICINSADTYWGFANAPECKAWLTQKNAEGKPLYYCYETAEESWEPLPAISQQALRNLPTYKGTTMIGTTDPLEPEITVSYRPQTDYSKLPGLEVDFESGVETRLGAAKKLTPGTAFNRYHMYGNRRRCNVLDDGTITAYEGEPGYTEDGSNGQVMVYQPKFYYQVVPLKLEPQTDGIGYHLRHAQYWVSPTLQPGFRLHPDFDVSGQEVDYVLLPAYEGSIYDTSEDAYILDDAKVMDVATDKLCSIAGAKPASGKIQQLTRPNVEQLARNRGPGWHSDNIKAVSANQLLMIIELGTMNTQAAIGQGVISIPDTPNTENNSIITGGTSSLGNNTGMAEGTNGKVSVSYRGMENPWGNIWKFVYGINIWGDGTKKGGIPYICKDYDFAENKNTGNYESAGFTLANANGYISAMGYSQEYDWLFLPSETLGNSSMPVGDYTYITVNLNGYRNYLFGGSWDSGSYAGAFCLSSIAGVGYCSRTISARLIYVPQ